MSANYTRRSFLGVGTVAALGGIAGLAGCAQNNNEVLAESGASAQATMQDSNGSPDWLGSEPIIADDEIVQTLDTDFLIVGAGNAGLAAATTAAQLNIDFILCEKNGAVQATREFFGAVNTKYVTEAGVEVDKLRLLNEVARYANGLADRSVLKVWVDESAETFEWIAEMMEEDTDKEFYLEISPDLSDHGFFTPTVDHRFVPNYEGVMRNDMYQGRIEAAGHEIKFEHDLVKLVHSEDNTFVSGAIFATPNGYVQINANKGVLLATGGYPANASMIRALNPVITKIATCNGFPPANDGTGIKTALWMDASMDKVPAAMIFNRGAVDVGVDAGYVSDAPDALFAGSPNQLNMGSQPFMAVNRNGMRFTNESLPYDHILNACCFQPGGVYCQVFDGNAAEDIDRFAQFGCARNTTDRIRNGQSIDEVCGRFIEEGVMKRADTLDELADQLGFSGESKQNFLDQVERYNELYDAQEDSDYGKEAYRLSAIRQAPFYGCWYGGILLTTCDGLTIDNEMRVLNNNGEAINGLYAAGDCSGSMFAGTYPEYIVGIACGRANTQGRHVARHIAGEI